MATLTTDDIDKMAHLAKLIVSKNDTPSLLKELNKILAMVAAMDQVDTTSIQPMAHPYDEKQTMRDDLVIEKNQRELFQKIAPKVEAGLYLVPTVIE